MVIEVHSRSLLAMLSPSAREKVIELSTDKYVAKGETVFREGDASVALFIIDTGSVALILNASPKGNRTFMTLGPGDLFSWSAMVEPHRETCTVKAIEDSRIIEIPAKELIARCKADHDVGFEIYRAMAVVLASRIRALQMHGLDVYSTP